MLRAAIGQPVEVVFPAAVQTATHKARHIFLQDTSFRSAFRPGMFTDRSSMQPPTLLGAHGSGKRMALEDVE